MARLDIVFIAWCNKDGHDKIWGYARAGSDDVYYNFYGRRGKRFTFKRYQYLYELERLAEQKTKKGRDSGTYSRLLRSEIETVMPGFYDEFEHQLTLAKLFENFHGERIS